MSTTAVRPDKISICPATAESFAFAERLYLQSTGPLLRALGSWDEAAARERLASSLHRLPAQLICLKGLRIGWIQVSQTSAGFHLHQVHIRGAYRNRGIGSRLIGDILERARGLGLPVSLNVIRGNPAISLYARLGFQVVGHDRDLLRMRWDPAPADNAPPAKQPRRRRRS